MILSVQLTSHHWASLFAAVMYALCAFLGARLSHRQAFGLYAVAWIAHAAGLITGLHTSDGLLQFGFAPALSCMAWLVTFIYVLENHWYPQFRTRWALFGFAALAVLLAARWPGATLHLDASVWLPLHWMVGMAAYGLFAAAFFHGWLLRRAEQQIRLAAPSDEIPPLLTLERLTFRLITLGFILLTLTLGLGWVFSDLLYGVQSGLKWNHKTIFSVLSWLTFAYLLWGRYRLGWRGQKAIRFLNLGSGLLLLSYVGSRFVLEVFLDRHP